VSDFDRVRALSFDCYGTLIDWEAGLVAELGPWAERHGLECSTDELLTAFSRCETEVQREHPGLRYPLVLETALERIAAQLGTTASADERRAFGASVGRWPAFPDSAEALARLHERFRLVILSNIDRESFAASNRRLGVEFDLVITAEEVGAYKPSERSFDALLAGVEALGVAPSELLHVAQSLYHDHEPARAAGLRSVWIDRRHDRDGFGATPPPRSEDAAPDWRFPSMSAFADAALA
jgi:2-haloalkanoic acid dehalogenase type II